MTSNNNYINSFFTGFIQSQFIKSTEKDKAKEREMETNLAALLSKLSQTLTKANSASPGNAGNTSSTAGQAPVSDTNDPTNNPTGAPSAQEIAQAIAAANAAIAELESQIDGATNEQFKSELEVQLAQMQNIANILSNLETIINEMNSATGSFQKWLSQQSAQFQQEWSYYVEPNENKGNNQQGTGYVNQPAIIQAVEQWVSQNLGININLNNDYGQSFGQFIQDATNQVQNYFNAKLAPAVQNMYLQMESTNNPVIQALMQLLKQGGNITAQDLKNLQDILGQVIKVLSELANSSSQPGGSGPSNALVIEMLSLMSGMMNQLEGQISQSTSNKGQDDVETATALAQQAQNALNKAIQEAAEIAQEKAEQNSLGIFMKVIEAIVAAVIAAVACAFGQFQIAAMVIVMAAMQESGAMQDITGAIATDLQKDGLISPEAAQAVADAIVVVIVMICTAGAGAAANLYNTGTLLGTTAAQAGSEAATQATQDAVDLAEANVERGIQEAMQAAAQAATDNTGSIISTVKDVAVQALNKLNAVLKVLNPFQYMPSIVNNTLGMTAQAIMQSNLINDATVAVDTAKGKDQATIAHDQMVGNILGSIIMTAISAGAFGQSMGGISNAAESSATKSNSIMKILNNFKAFLNNKLSPTTITYLYKIGQLGGGIAEAGGQAGLGISYSRQAAAEAALGADDAEASFFQELEKITNTGMTNSQTTASNILKGHEQINNAVYSSMLAYEATFAQLFSQAV